METRDPTDARADRGLRAFMFTDMVGYTALTEKDAALAITLLEEQRVILRSIFPHHSGTEIDVIGDAFFVEFTSAVNAVRCAEAVRDAIMDRNEGSPQGEPILLRIGIHMGEAVYRGGKPHGDGVNVASRIHALAGPGEILVSAAIATQVRNIPRFGLDPRGSHLLKNVTHPVELFAVTRPGGPAAGPAKSARAQAPAPESPTPPSYRKWWILGSAVAVAACGLYLLIFTPPPPAPASPRRSIAVMPFRNLDTNKETEYFAEGITEDIISHVSRIEGVRVIAASSVAAYRNTTLSKREIAAELQVESLLEGSVRKDGRRVKIVAELVDPSTGTQLWRDIYERILTDIFKIQDEIAVGVAGGLEAKFLVRAPAAGESRGASYVEAYDLSLRGRYHWNRRTPSDIRAALELFGAAIAKDSTFAPAYVGIADCYTVFGSPEYGVLPPKVAYDTAESAIRTALRLDSTLAEAHATFASILFNYHWNWKDAERHFKRALALNPNYAAALVWYGDALLALGRFGESRALYDAARTLDPLNLNVRMSHGVLHFFAGRSDSALTVLDSVRVADTSFIPVYLWLGLALSEEGRDSTAIRYYDRAMGQVGRITVLLTAQAISFAREGNTASARAIIGELQSIADGSYVSPYYFGAIYSSLGDQRAALRWFSRAVEEKSGAIIYMKVNPLLKSLRRDPEFAPILGKIRFE